MQNIESPVLEEIPLTSTEMRDILCFVISSYQKKSKKVQPLKTAFQKQVCELNNHIILDSLDFARVFTGRKEDSPFFIIP